MAIRTNSLKIIALVLFSFFSIYNNAKWGASFSYVLVPFALFVLLAVTERIQVRKSVMFIFVIYMLYFISTAISNYVTVGREFFSFAIFCIFYIMAVSLDYTCKELRIFIISYIVIALSVSCNICYQWLNHHYMQAWLQRTSFYFMGHFKDPNYAFAFISPAIILAIMIFFHTKSFKIKFAISINLIISLLALMIASSRAGMLAIFVSAVSMILFSNKIRIATKIRIVFLIVIVLLAARYFILNSYNEYALNRMFNDTDGGGRLEIWESALEVFRKDPVLGGGLNSGSYVSALSTGYPTHSIFFDILCDSGIIGLISIIYFVLKNCIRCRRDNIEFQIILAIACIIPMLFINGFNTTTFFYPLIMLNIFSRYLETNDYLPLVNFSKEYD